MAFILNLKLRNFSDTFIRYAIEKYFPDSSKCKTEPTFLKQALIQAVELEKHPDYLHKSDKDYIKILKSLCFLRRLDLKFISEKSNDKLRVALDGLYNLASVKNSLTISLNLKEFTAIGSGKLNSKTLNKYILLFQEKKILKKVKWKISEGVKLYPLSITLIDLSMLKKTVKLRKPRYIPHDGYQNFSYFPKIGERGLQIVELIRRYGGMSSSELYTYYEDLKDHRHVILKKIKSIVESGIIHLVDGKYELTGVSFNKAYDDFIEQYNAHRPYNKKPKKTNPMKNKIINYQMESIFINNAIAKKQKT